VREVLEDLENPHRVLQNIQGLALFDLALQRPSKLKSVSSLGEERKLIGTNEKKIRLLLVLTLFIGK